MEKRKSEMNEEDSVPSKKVKLDDDMPTEEELQNPSLAALKMLHLDRVHFEYGADYTLDTSKDPEKFIIFTDRGKAKINEFNFDTIFWKFEKTNCDLFMAEVADTRLMKYLYEYGKEKRMNYLRKEFSEYTSFLKWLENGWMAEPGPFEHVFYGVQTDNESEGLHNVIRLHLLQEKGRIRYVDTPAVNDLQDPLLANLKFRTRALTRRGAYTRKGVSTVFLGTSPYYEFALYSLCRILKKADQEFDINGSKFKIRLRGTNRAGFPITAYPVFRAKPIKH